MTAPDLTPAERATVDAILRELPMSDDGTGHVADCGYTEADPSCGCLTLPERIAARVAEAADAREAEVRARLEEYASKFDSFADTTINADDAPFYRAIAADFRAALAPADNDGEAP